MAGAVVNPGNAPPPPRVGGQVADKGLRKGAISFISSVVIGVASTAPGYSLAATLGLIVAAVGFQAPAVLWVAFIPMLCIASAYLYMNRTDPDCGTTFAWVTKAMGPWAGWLGGWAIIVADVVVMANLAQIAGLYSFTLFGWDSAASSVACGDRGRRHVDHRDDGDHDDGIELSARTQWYLLGAEVDDAGGVRGRRARARLHRRCAGGLRARGAVVVLAVRDRRRHGGADDGRPAGRSSSTGAGTAR